MSYFYLLLYLKFRRISDTPDIDNNSKTIQISIAFQKIRNICCECSRHLIYMFFFDIFFFNAAARQDQLSDVEVVTVNFNVLHDPASNSTSSPPSKALPKASLPSSTSTSSSSTSTAAAALPNSPPSSSSSSSMGGKTPAPILNTALYLNKLKQSSPSEGKNWWVNNEEKQGEGNENDKDAVDGNSASGEAKQGRRESEDFSYGAKNVSDEKDKVKEIGGGGG